MAGCAINSEPSCRVYMAVLWAIPTRSSCSDQAPERLCDIPEIWLHSPPMAPRSAALPVLVGWFPDLMKTRIGSVNAAYLFALSQFFMAWIVAGIYVVKAAGWDKSAAQIIAKFKK